MEKFNLVRIVIKEPQSEFNSNSLLKKLSLKIVTESSINFYNFPLSPILFPILSQASFEIYIFQDQIEISKLTVPLESISRKQAEFKLDIAISPAQKIASKLLITIELVTQDSYQIVPEALLAKFKEDLNDIKSLRLLLEDADFLIKESNQVYYHELGLDFDVLNFNEAVTRQQAEHLKNVVIGLNEKLKVLNLVELIIKETQKIAFSNLEAREEMHGVNENARNLMEKVRERQDCTLKGVHEKINEIQGLLNKSVQRNEESIIEIDRLKGAYEILKGENEQLQSKQKNFDDIEQMIRNLQSNISNLETNRHQMIENSKKTQEEYDKLISYKDLEYEKISNLNQTLEKTIETQQSQIFSYQTTISGLESTITSLLSTIKTYESEIIGYKDLDQKAAQMESLSKKHQQECLKSIENTQKTTSKFSEVLKTINQEKIKLLKNASELNGKIQETQKKNQNLNEKLNLESLKLKEIKILNQSFQSTINSSIDSQHISRQLLKLFSDFSKHNEKYNIDAFIFVKSFTEISYEFRNLNKILDQLKELIMNRDEEILVLMDIITELQRRMPYVPVKDDPVDVAMAEYSNNRDEPLDIPFVREDCGIYFFGTKRIFIKIDNGKLSSKE